MHRAPWLGVLSCALLWTAPLRGHPVPGGVPAAAPFSDFVEPGTDPSGLAGPRETADPPPPAESLHARPEQSHHSGADTVRLTLTEAVERALAESPAVRAAEGAVRAPRGLRSEALWPFPSNPELEFGRVRREVAGERSTDREWVLTQEIEVAGQNFVRASAAGKRVRSAESLVEDARRRAALEVREAYVVLNLAERRALLTDSAATFAERLADVAGRQLEAGEVNRLTYNAAVLEAARQRSVADRALAELDAAAADVARLLALPDTAVPRTAGLPPIPGIRPDTLALLGLARERRPDLRAADLDARAADQGVTAARLGLVPNLLLGGVVASEEGADLTGLSIGVSIPLFHRQQAATGEARAEAAAARAEHDATARRVQAQIRISAEQFRRAVLAERRFADDVLRAATENVTLTDRAFAEGKVDVTDVVVLRRAAVDARLEYLAVLSDVYTAWFELAAAAGVEPEDLTDLPGASRE